MARSARIESPEILKEFRNRFVVFDGDCRRALEGVKTDINSTVAWLNGEQLSYWKQQLRKREEMVLKAKSAYHTARLGGQSHCLIELKDLQKAQRLKEEAEQKMLRVKKWVQQIERKSAMLLGPCMRLSVELADLTPRALSRLDTMIDSLDAYFRAAAGDGAASSSGES